ncbi:hypothetical protein AMS60_05565 [Bacillus sp. FJAT-21945]|nr:hypothetical protein AMS60_05565 [Bacillus sp. FJAT-21945]
MKDLVPKRKSEVRFHEILPNGQHLNIYFQRSRNGEFNQWGVGLHIGKSRKEANKWYNKHSKNKRARSTGTCGITGLKRALFYILHFRDQMKTYEELIIEWEDDKRMRAYRYLKRYEFVDYFDDKDKVIGYGSRNLQLWEYTKEVGDM